MAHDPHFEARIAQALLAKKAKAVPVKMFGGVCFMVNGNMAVGITNKGDFMARFDAARHDEVSAWPGAKPMTMAKGGKPGFLFVDAPNVADKKSLERWVALSLEWVTTLPAKTKKKPLVKKSAVKRPLASR